MLVHALAYGWLKCSFHYLSFLKNHAKSASDSAFPAYRIAKVVFFALKPKFFQRFCLTLNAWLVARTDFMHMEIGGNLLFHAGCFAGPGQTYYMRERLFLIDGHALIFKMYYAFLRRPMVNSKGADMSVLFGFTKYMLELIDKENPEYLAVAFDPPGGTFRNELYPEYKANRAETPQLVIDSLEPLMELCRAMNIPVLMVPGYEADDVIGSMAKREAAAGLDVYMVTPDKDYGQVVSDNIFQIKPGRAGGENELLDKAAVCAKYGIGNPLQVIEMLTICGDSADNVPGVKGVGEVGASKLISKYGSVENIFRHLDELSPRQQQQFREAEPHIALSHELVTIRTDMDLPVKEEEMRLDRNFRPQLAELFEKYEFSSLKKYLPAHLAASCADRIEKMKLNEVPPEEFAGYAEANGLVAVELDADGDEIFSGIRNISLATCSQDQAAGREAYVSSGSPEEFRNVLSDGTICKYGENLKFQLNVLASSGFSLAGRLLDISLMHYLINPEADHGLETLALNYSGIDAEASEAAEDAVGPMSLFDAEPDVHVMNQSRAAAALLSGIKILEDLHARSLTQLYDEMEEPLIRVLSKMELSGVNVDLHQIDLYVRQLQKELTEREAAVRRMAGVPDLNVSSPKQVGEVIFSKLNLDPKIRKTSRGNYPTDEATLSALSDRHPIIDEILEFRAVKKLLSTYIEPFPSYVSPVDGRVHTTFNQALTATGRLSSSSPNLQNIPIRTERGKEIRKAFVGGAQDSLIVSADYSQIELRIMAHLSQDGHLLAAFRNGEDIHAATAAKIFGITPAEVTADQRRRAKTANFGIMYGISSFGLSQRLGISRAEAKKLIEDYFNAFPSVRSFIDDTIAAARENGYVETLFGRRRYLPDINSKNATMRSLAERNAVNAPIQGTAADIIKLAMIGVDRKISEAGLKSRMVLQIHDELLFDAVHDEIDTLVSIVRGQMEHVTELSVPLTVECNYGKNWLEAH